VKIKKWKWGEIEFEDGTVVKDAKVDGNGVSVWDWSEHGTRHGSGVTLEEIKALEETGCEYIVIGKGFDLMLSVSLEAMAYIGSGAEGVPIVYALGTEHAVKEYNKLLSEYKRVGALIHSTC